MCMTVSALLIFEEDAECLGLLMMFMTTGGSSSSLPFTMSHIFICWPAGEPLGFLPTGGMGWRRRQGGSTWEKATGLGWPPNCEDGAARLGWLAARK